MPKGISNITGLPVRFDKHHSEETKKRISEAIKRNPARFWLGKKYSEEHKRKIVETRKKNNSYSWDEKRKNNASKQMRERMSNPKYVKMIGEKISQSLIGHKHSFETRQKISNVQIGRKYSKETIEKMKNSQKKRVIEGRNHLLKGGIFNYERRLFLNRKRRIMKLNANGFHTFGEWETLKVQYNWTCPACKKSEPEIKLTEDHIVPLSKGGSDNIENIQPLCKSCNAKKHIKVIKYEIEGVIFA